MIDPYYTSKTQRLWRFPNNYGASVVKIHDGTHEVAPISFSSKGPEWFIDYHTPLGRPKSGLSEADALAHVELISQLPEVKP